MMETVIVLKPQDQWPKRESWYSKLGAWPAAALRALLARPQGTQELIYGPGGLNEALHHAGRRQCLDDADQSAHRHADHRHAHPARHQGAGLRSGRDRAIGKQIEKALKEFPEPPASSPNARPADTFWTSTSSAMQLAR